MKVPPLAPPSWQMVEYRGREGLEQLEPDWRRLCETMSARTVFHSYDAQAAYFDLLMARPESFRCLVLLAGDEARAIVPLEARTDRMLRVPVWGTPNHPHMPFSDVIAPEDETREMLLPMLLEYLESRAERRPLLVLGPLPAGSALWSGMDGIPRNRWCDRETMPADVFDCSRPTPEVMAGVAKSLRTNLGKNLRRLHSLHEDVRFATASEPSDLEAAFDAFLDLEASGWKGPDGTGSAIGLHPELVAFYRRLADGVRSADGADGCEINGLYVDGRCIAGEFCVRTGGQYTKLKIAYDQEYSRVSPGSLLFGHTLERCCNDSGVERINCVTSLDWRRAWHPTRLPMRQAHIALGLVSAITLIPVLRLGYGPLRSAVRFARAKSGRYAAARRGNRPVERVS